MENQLTEAKPQELSGDIKILDSRIKMMKGFVQNQLVEGINNDFALIPHTGKRTLLKAGAEKLLMLFKLGFKFEIISQTIDLIEGTVFFLIKCKVYSRESGVELGEYMGCCSNQEKKYIRQAPADIINTILKMAEKRAMVGATISVTGASDYFTQDLEDAPKNQSRSRTNDADKFQNNNVSDSSSFVCTFGKHEGKTLEQIGAKDLTNYINYVTKDGAEINGKMLEFVNKGRDFLKAV